MLKAHFALVIAAVSLSGCAEQAATRLAGDTVRLHISTAPIYGALEPQRRAMRMAAEETVKNGYDKFMIVDSANAYRPNVIGQTPAQYQSSSHATVAGGPGGISGYGASQATYTGPRTIAMPRFESDVIVKMFKAADPAGSNAIDAREILKADVRK